MLCAVYYCTTMKSHEHCGYVCFITLATVAEIASVSLNLKEHKTPREKAEVTARDLGLAVFPQELKVLRFSATDPFRCLDDVRSFFNRSSFYSIGQMVQYQSTIYPHLSLICSLFYHIPSIYYVLCFRYLHFHTFMPFISYFPVFLL